MSCGLNGERIWFPYTFGQSTIFCHRGSAEQSRVRYPCLRWLLRMVFFFPHVRQYNFGVQVIIFFFFYCYEGVILCKYWQSPCRSTDNPRVSQPSNHPRRRRMWSYILFSRVFEQSHLWFIFCYYLPAMHSGYTQSVAFESNPCWFWMQEYL